MWLTPCPVSHRKISNSVNLPVFSSLSQLSLVRPVNIHWFYLIFPTCCTRSSQSKAATQPKRQGSWVPRDVLLRCFTCDIDNCQNLNGQYLLWILDTYDLWISMDNWGVVILELLYIYIYIQTCVSYHFSCFYMATHEWTLAENQRCFFLIVNYNWNLCVRANFWWIMMENEIIIHCMTSGEYYACIFSTRIQWPNDNDGGLSMMGWR